MCDDRGLSVTRASSYSHQRRAMPGNCLRRLPSPWMSAPSFRLPVPPPVSSSGWLDISVRGQLGVRPCVIAPTSSHPKEGAIEELRARTISNDTKTLLRLDSQHPPPLFPFPSFPHTLPSTHGSPRRAALDARWLLLNVLIRDLAGKHFSLSQ